MSSTLRSSGIPVHFIWRGEGKGREGGGEERRGGQFLYKDDDMKKTRLEPVTVPSLSPLKTG